VEVNDNDLQALRRAAESRQWIMGMDRQGGVCFVQGNPAPETTRLTLALLDEVERLRADLAAVRAIVGAAGERALRAEEDGRMLAAALAHAREEAAYQRGMVEQLRAIIEGRAVPPTAAEMAAHAAVLTEADRHLVAPAPAQGVSVPPEGPEGPATTTRAPRKARRIDLGALTAPAARTGTDDGGTR
jgi:hypothetical protein